MCQAGNSGHHNFFILFFFFILVVVSVGVGFVCCSLFRTVHCLLLSILAQRQEKSETDT